MAINADVLQSALQELMPSYSELFVKWHPVLERVLLKGNLEKNVLTGPFREFAVVTDGPGDVTQIVTGSEIVNGGRNQNAARGNTYAPRMIYAFDVPGKDLAEANGEMDLARIIQHYPELALSDFHERIAKQIVQGDATNVGGFLPLRLLSPTRCLVLRRTVETAGTTSTKTLHLPLEPMVALKCVSCIMQLLVSRRPSVQWTSFLEMRARTSTTSTTSITKCRS